MSLILNIETAHEGAAVSLSRNGNLLQSEYSPAQKDHASWMHPAIEEMILREGLGLRDLQAVAVSIGPGSYTGLRIGLSAAKGFCYALEIPLITIGTLEILAVSVQHEAKELICPMIDARRMEVYAALYSKEMNELSPPHALILEAGSFHEQLNKHAVLFCGSGSVKLKTLVSHPNAAFSTVSPGPQVMAALSHHYFTNKRFTEIAYSEPLYVKEFYSKARRI